MEYNESENSDNAQDNVRHEQYYENSNEKLVHVFHDDRNKNKNEASNEATVINAKDYIFLESISKNSGIENE